MEKIKVGITGQGGFIGSHLVRKIAVSDDFECVEFTRDFFSSAKLMRNFTDRCDVIIHLAGLSRHEDGSFLYQTNVGLTKKLLSFARPGQRIFFGSTTHEGKDSPYHASKRDCRALIEKWAGECHGFSRTLLMPNVFGTGSRPFYNSVVSSFCAIAARGGKTPEKMDAVELKLIDVDALCFLILNELRNQNPERTLAVLPHRYEIMLPDLWRKLASWRSGGMEKPPVLESSFEVCLWQTFCSYYP